MLARRLQAEWLGVHPTRGDGDDPRPPRRRTQGREEEGGEEMGSDHVGLRGEFEAIGGGDP